MSNLSDLHVLVTRPDPAGSELCDLIDKQQGIATYFPTIEFAQPENVTKFQHEINALADKDWLIFISPRAVYESVADIRKAWPIFPPTLHFAAVGEGTAKALRNAGYDSIHPKDDWSSEGLLALPEFTNVSGKKIVIIRGENGRKLLAQSLIERGAGVSHLIAYQRVLPSGNVSIPKQSINVIVTTSAEGLQNLVKLTGDWIKSIALIVISERMKELAQDLGFQPIWVANNASHEAILNLLAQKKDAICRIKQTKI